MTRSEFLQLGNDIFLELLPKVKEMSRDTFLSAFLDELQAQGLDIEDDYMSSDDLEGDLGEEE
jgi:hypothetical protein